MLYTISCVLLAISGNIAMLIAFRGLQGIASAMIFSSSIAILTAVFPPGERGKALGIQVAAVYLGASMGPILGGILTQQFGWRSIFISNLPLGGVSIILLLWKMKGEWGGASREKFDLRGSLIYGIAIIALLYGLSRLPAVLGAALVAFGLLGIVIFIWWETRVRSPLLNIGLFKTSRVFAFSNLTALLNYIATFAVTFLLSLYLQYTKGFSPQYAGLILVAMPGVQAAVSPMAGRLSDRISPQIITAIGMASATIGLSLLAFLTNDTAIGFIITGLVFIGLGIALFSSPNTNAIMSSIGTNYYGIASATLATMRQVGMMLSMGIVMLIFAIYLGGLEIIPAYYPAFVDSARIAFAIFAALCFLGVFTSLASGRKHHQEPI